MNSSPENTGGNRKPNGRFKPGMSGNPNGRPKGSTSYSDALRRILCADKMNLEYRVGKKIVKKEVCISGDHNNFYDAIAASQIKLALSGDQKAVNQIIDRMEGRAKQSIDMKKEVSGELSINIKKRVIRNRNEIKPITTRETVETIRTVTENYDVDEII